MYVRTTDKVTSLGVTNIRVVLTMTALLVLWGFPLAFVESLVGLR